jgi:hypothetical protein
MDSELSGRKHKTSWSLQILPALPPSHIYIQNWILPSLIHSVSKARKWRTLHSISSEPLEFIPRTNSISSNLQWLLDTSSLYQSYTPAVSWFVFLKRKSECHGMFNSSAHCVRDISTDLYRIRKGKFEGSIPKCWAVCTRFNWDLLSIRRETEVKSSNDDFYSNRYF